MLTGVDFVASPCAPSPVSAIRTPKLPLLPVWEKGVGGMRGKGAQECRKWDAHRSSAPGTFQNDQELIRQECILSIKIWYDTASDRSRST